jgi:hypothetical protein
MTAEEARQLTKAALINTTVLQNLDKAIAKAAKDGKYSVNANITGSDGYTKYLSCDEMLAIQKHYKRLGFETESQMDYHGTYSSISISWLNEIEMNTEVLASNEENID